LPSAPSDSKNSFRLLIVHSPRPPLDGDDAMSAMNRL